GATNSSRKMKAATWRRLSPSGPPPSGRSGCGLVYDVVGRRVIAFGGYDGSRFIGDVWALSMREVTSWTELQPASVRPGARSYMQTAYDSPRNRMLIFGGWDGSFLGDVWALSLGEDPTWAQL